MTENLEIVSRVSIFNGVLNNRSLRYELAYRGITIAVLPNNIIEIEGYKDAEYSIDEDFNPTLNKMMGFNNTTRVIFIQQGLKVINFGAFSGFYALESIMLPNSIERIDDLAFYNCARLKNINIVNGCEISKSAFSGCKSLEFENLMGGL